MSAVTMAFRHVAFTYPSIQGCVQTETG